MINLNNNGYIIGRVIKKTVANNQIMVAIDSSQVHNKPCLHFVTFDYKFNNQLNNLKANQKVKVDCYLTSTFHKQGNEHIYQMQTIATDLHIL